MRTTRMHDNAPKRDDDELRVLRPILDIIRDDRHVPEIQRGVDLVHEVQRRRLVRVEREHERERAQRLLSTRQVRDVAPALLRRHDAEDDTLRERVHAVDELELGVPSERDHLSYTQSDNRTSWTCRDGTYLVHLLELVRDVVEALHELVMPVLAQLVVKSLLRIAVGGCLSEGFGAMSPFRLARAVLLDDRRVRFRLVQMLCYEK